MRGTGARGEGPGARKSRSETPGRDLRAIYSTLSAAYGPQHWWPAQTAFEVMLGAILTQNTAWTNVERALGNLSARGPLTAEAVLGLGEAELAELIRPAGYFNVKARRLRAYCAAWLAAGGHAALAAQDTARLRAWLLAIHGIGPETADDIMLYAFNRPVFVVDAYTRRLFSRLGLLTGDEGYEAIRARFESDLRPASATTDDLVRCFNEYHALIVRHAKDCCRARAPRCGDCCLAGGCAEKRRGPRA